MSDYRWSLGTLVGFPVLVLVCLVLAVVAALCWVWFRSEMRSQSTMASPGEALAFAGLATFVFLLIVVLTAVGMWPYKAEYHQWRTTAGTVTDVDSRLLSSGDGGPTERFV